MDKKNQHKTLDSSKDFISHSRIYNRLTQNILLIWLDNNIDDTQNNDFKDTIMQLRCVVNDVNTFTDADQCIDFVTDIVNEKVCMIISDSLGEHIVPVVHEMLQVDSIFIFCGHRRKHEYWIKQWTKIKGVYTEISSISQALKEIAEQCEQDAISISFLSTNDDISKKSLDQLDSSFMYTQILKDSLLKIQFDEKHVQEFIDYCQEQFANNDHELVKINEFQQKYRDQTPIWWYTRECFLYPMLNRSLRVMDVDIMIKMGFFICDLHHHIEQLYEKQFGNHQSAQILTVYRGQGLTKTDFDQMVKAKGGLLSFNNFLSTSKKRNISCNFARRALRNPDLVGILFVMTIDSSILTTPFASITDVSYYRNAEDEVLFSMQTVFRIHNIKQMDEDKRICQVDLTLTSDNDPALLVLTKLIREETERPTGWIQLSLLLLKMGQSNKAEQIYEFLLEHTSDDYEKAQIYHDLGIVKTAQGRLTEALEYYKKVLETQQTIFPPNHRDMAMSYNNIGEVYRCMGESSKALSYYEKARVNFLIAFPSNHPNLALPYFNTGTVYESMGDYPQALLFNEKALAIREKALPTNHPDMSASYNNIGVIQMHMGELSKALSSLEKAFDIREKSLPPNHPDIATSYTNIGEIYRRMGANSKALSHYEKAIEIWQTVQPVNHLNLTVPLNNIGVLYMSMGEYSKALSFYEKVLKIQQEYLPQNHPDIGISYNNIGVIYAKKEELLKALPYFERALDIRQRSLPPNHPCLQNYKEALESLKGLL